MATKFASLSGYHYAYNSPVMFNDPLGAQGEPGNPWFGGGYRWMENMGPPLSAYYSHPWFVSSQNTETGNVPHERLSKEVVVQQPGYVYIYLSNDNDQPLEVFFDDFTVTHAHSAIVQADDYYPFGMTFNGYKRESSMMNRFLYQGKELQSGTASYDFHARMYDPALGRTFQLDPHSESYLSLSGYSWVDNNPLVNTDPTGADIQYGQGAFGGHLYTGEDMVKMLLSLQAQFRELNEGREKERNKERERKEEEARAEVAQSGGSGNSLLGDAREPYDGFLGGLEYLFTGGNENGIHYDRDGNPTGLAPMTGSPDFIGGSLRKGQQAIKLGKYLFNPTYFHRTIKPDVLKKVGDFAKTVGNNPDIGLNGTKIILTGAKSGPYKGKTLETGLSILDFIF